MTADERLALIRPKIERAKQHILDLHGAIGAFLKANPYAVGTKRDPNTRELIYYVSRVDPAPLAIAAIAGDVVHNLRAALDHLHQHLLAVGSGRDSPGNRNHETFYIDGDPNPDHYKTSAPAKVKGLREDAIDALNRIEPYRGGNGHDLWTLHELNNIDKHRALVVVASAYRSMSVWPIARRHFESLGITIPAEAVEAMNLASFIRPADRKCPLKVGDVLFADAPDAEPDQKMQFRFEVAINEPEVVEGKPLVETLQHLAHLVGDTVARFRPCLE